MKVTGMKQNLRELGTETILGRPQISRSTQASSTFKQEPEKIVTKEQIGLPIAKKSLEKRSDETLILDL